MASTLSAESYSGEPEFLRIWMIAQVCGKARRKRENLTQELTQRQENTQLTRC